MKVLQWVFLAEKQLMMEGLCHALSVDPDSSNNEFERDNFPSETSLISYCLGLVILNEGTTIIRLVHKSLQDYFDTEYKKGQLFAGGHKDIVLICLTYMNFNYPDSEHLECADIPEFAEKTLKDYAFLDYSDSSVDVNDQFKRGASSLVLTTIPNHEHILYQLQRIEIDINSQDGYRETALVMAATKGHTDVVRLLPEREDIDVDLKGGESYSALLGASYNGHEDIVRLLLERNDVDVN
ncbi:ankyrin repeat-containing domain protein [Pyronema domesticum]|nr:ankyrin repeat-containing domain protein [Pyronema domesticum]